MNRSVPRNSVSTWIRLGRSRDRRRRIVQREQVRRLSQRRPREKAGRAFVRPHQTLDVLAQPSIAAAGLDEEWLARVGGARESVLEDVVDSPPAIRIHLGRRPLKPRRRQRVVEPGAREAPLAFDRGRRQLHDLGHLRDRQAAEELELDDAALARVDRFQGVEGLVQSDQIHGGRFTDSCARLSVTLSASPPRLSAARPRA